MAELKIKTLPPLDLDLGESALRYLRLLTKIHIRQKKQDGRHSNRDPMLNAIRRYEHFWLPLYAENADLRSLKPPWDVYYVWCLHMLMSSQYRDYCLFKYGRVLGHDFKFIEDSVEEDAAQQRSREIWDGRFPAERFEASVEGTDTTMPEWCASELNTVIIDSEQKQAIFFYQVSLSHFRDSEFLAEAVNRYRGLLYLKRDHPEVDLCLTNDLELIRQGHVLSPVQYEADLVRILGEFVEFTAVNRTVCDVTAHGLELEAKTSIEATARLWSAKYKTDYEIPGTKHRGFSEEGSFTKATQSHLKESEPETILISLNQIKISDLWSHDQKIVIEGRRLANTSYTYDVLFRISGKAGEALSNKVQRVSFNLRENRGIELHTFGIKGKICFKCEEHIATSFFDPRKLYAEDEKLANKDLMVDVPRVLYGDPDVSFHCRIEVIQKTKPHIFVLYREEFAPCSIPADLKPFAKLSSWSGAETFNTDIFNSARHSVRIPGGWSSNFTCHVVISRDLDLGGVLLYENGTELVAAAHSVGEDQLPAPNQVSPGYQLSLDRISGQHAMLIRNHDGDWGICIIKKDPDLNGVVVITFENLQHHYIRETTFTFEESTILRIDHMSVDLYSGAVTLTSDRAEAAEYVTLAYVIGILYVFTSGHQAPEVTSRHPKRKNGVITSSPTAGPMTSKKKMSRAKSTKYKVSSNQLSQGFSSSVTLSNLKTSRKKKPVVCSMLLACGLHANMPWEEDLKRMSVHSEASLLSRSSLDHVTSASPEMWSEIPLHSDYSLTAENIDRLTSSTTHRAQTWSAVPIPSTNDQFSFRKADDVTRHKSPPIENQSRTSEETRKVRRVPPSGITYENKIVRRGGGVPIARREPNRDSCDTDSRLTSRVPMHEHDSAVPELLLNVHDIADSSQVAMTVDLENRAQDIVDRFMAGVTCKEAKVISTRGQIALGFDSDEPIVILHEENEERRLNTRL